MPVQTIDIYLIVAYFFVVLGIGIYVARREQKQAQHGEVSSAEYFLAGRSLTWVTIGFSLFASNISSTTLIGLSGAAYSTGISISNYEWVAAIILVFFAVFFIPYYVGNNIFTMPEFLEKRFDGRSRSYFSVLTIIGNVFIDTAGTLFAGALVIKFFFPSIEFWQSASILALMAGIYTALGGLAAVVYTDVIQAVILMIGSAAVALLAYDQVGSWDNVVAQTPESLLSIVQPRSDSVMPWTGLLVGVPVLGFYFWCTNQFIVQRVLGAKNIEHARWGALFAGLLKLPVLYLMVYPGVMARLLYPDLETPDLVFPTMVSDLLPVGLKGLVLAGLVAAIMSSIDSTLHSASTLVTMDFVNKFKPHLKSSKLTMIGRIVTVIFMIISILWVPVVAQFETLFSYLQSALAYLVPPIVSVFILGLFWKRTTSFAAFWGLVTGHITSLTVLVLINMEIISGLHFLEVAGLLTLITALGIVALSYFDPKPDHLDNQDWVWSKESNKKLVAALPQRVWWQDYRWQSVLLIALTALLVMTNW